MIREPVIAAVAALALAAPVTALAAAPPSHGSVDRAAGRRFESRHETASRDLRTACRFDRSSHDTMSREHRLDAQRSLTPEPRGARTGPAAGPRPAGARLVTGHA